MISSRYRRRQSALTAVLGLVILQLGIRGVFVHLQESNGNTYDVIGDVNGPEFGWMLIPESWAIDLITRYTYWLLLLVGTVLLIRAVQIWTDKHLFAVIRPALVVIAIWMALVGGWGALLVVTKNTIVWSPPEILFPSPLYFVIHTVWPLFLVGGLFVAAMILIPSKRKKEMNGNR